MKFNRLLTAGAALMAIIALPLAASAQGGTKQDTKPKQSLTADQKKAVLDDVVYKITHNAFVPGVDFDKFPEYLAKEQSSIDKTTDITEFTAAINRAFRNFGASHIVLSSPEMAAARENRSMVGLGVQIDIIEEGIKIVGVLPLGPAKEAGIEPGDILILANGKKPQSREDLGGAEGTKIKLKVKKSDGKLVDIEITRRKFSTVVPETLEWPNEKTALLRIPSFDLGYSRTNVEKLINEASKADTLILDLRMNGGGAVINLLHLSSYFLPERAVLGTFINRYMVQDFVEETKGDPKDLKSIAAWTNQKVRAGTPKDTVKPFKGKVVCLVNGGTGSASEMMAAALREHLKSPIIGETSAGAVLASVIIPIREGFSLQYPFTDYITKDGIRLEGNGIQPDVKAATPKDTKTDPGVQAALKLIEHK